MLPRFSGACVCARLFSFFPKRRIALGYRQPQKQPQILKLIFSSKSKSFKPTDTKSRFFQNFCPENLVCVWCPAFFIFDSKTHKPIQTVIRPNPILPTQTFLGPPEPDFTYTNFSDAPNPILPTQTFLGPPESFIHFIHSVIH